MDVTYRLNYNVVLMQTGLARLQRTLATSMRPHAPNVYDVEASDIEEHFEQFCDVLDQRKENDDTKIWVEDMMEFWQPLGEIGRAQLEEWEQEANRKRRDAMEALVMDEELD